MHYIEADKQELDTRPGWEYYGKILYAKTSDWASRPHCGISIHCKKAFDIL